MQRPAVITSIQELWRGLSARTKSGIAIGVLTCLIGVLGLGVHHHRNRYIELYPSKMVTKDVPEVSRALVDMRIDHEITPTDDGILLHPNQKTRALAGLAARDLPLHPVTTANEVVPNMARTSLEQLALRQRVLAGEITLALRAIDGINDARVTLAVPEKTYFQDDGKSTKASVTLTLVPGHDLSREGIRGILKLIAASGPELSPENVQLSDTQGRDLSSLVPLDPEGRLEVAGTQFEVRAAEEGRQQAKLQAALDQIFPGRAKVLVNLDLDFSTVEKRVYTPGSEKDDGMVRDSMQLVQEMLEGAGTKALDKDGDKSYSNKKEAVNYKYTENYFAQLMKEARVDRVTASVLADGMSASEAASLKEVVKGALGVKEERGDFVYVDITPWDRTMIQPQTAVTNPLALDSADRNPLSANTLLGLLAVQSALMVGGFGGYLYLTSRKNTQPSIETASGPLQATVGIVDHGLNKSGLGVNREHRTSVQTSDLLQNIVKERPSQVADMLRSTWLSGS